MTTFYNKQKREIGNALNFSDILNFSDPLNGVGGLTTFTNKSKH